MLRRSFVAVAKLGTVPRHGPPAMCVRSSLEASSQTLQYQYHQHRHFSDRLLGLSPMAPAAPTGTDEESRIPTERDVQIAGGVWNPISAKRDKLGELKVELLPDQDTLDDAATKEQLRDLYLVDGIQWIVHTVEQCRLKEHTAGTSSNNSPSGDAETAPPESRPKELDPTQWETEEGLLEVVRWMSQQETSIQSTVPDGKLTKEQWETYLDEVIQKMEEVLATLPAGRYLPHVRDFYTLPLTVVQTGNQEHTLESLLELQSEISASPEQQQLAMVGNSIVARYRLQLARATCQQLRENWDALTKLSDAALDRLAVHVDGEDSPGASQRQVLSLLLLNKLLKACLTGNAIDRVDTMWDLVDRNGDGLLEKADMEQVAAFTVASVQSAMVTLFEEALEASPVVVAEDATVDDKNKSPLKQPGFFARRRESQAKKRLKQAFQRAVTKHFQDEVEMPHRLRCIYAWAEKAHQNNRLDSVLIEASGWSGRKRYVELSPKISLAEFREVQQIHLTHLDRIGWEITKSFREDLWVAQGKGRQGAELRRDCMIFLVVVSLIDYGIMIL